MHHVSSQSKSNAAVSPAKKTFLFSFCTNLHPALRASVRFPGGGDSRAIRRFAPPRASSLPLPLSPTGSGAWTCWRGPGDHSTHRRISGIPQKVTAMRRVWAPLANPNRLAAVRCNQSKLNAVRCWDAIHYISVLKKQEFCTSIIYICILVTCCILVIQIFVFKIPFLQTTK